MSRRALYSTVGALLALGAPLGLLLLQAIRARRSSWEWLVAELAEEPALYLYTTVCTLVAFALFGYVLGREGDALHDLARTDPLTGLLNRRAFAERLREELARSVRYQAPVSLLLLDLDGLKRLNDQSGHREGDAALRALARALALGSRSADLAARWGGDEFVMLAPETGRAEARDLAERIRSSVASSGPAGVTVSIGVATAEAAATMASADLEAAADAALYDAKRQGGNRVVASLELGDPSGCASPGA
jgi:diguanylate cyclase (GGDEF)-like protein